MYEKQGTWLAMRTANPAALIPEWSHGRHFLRVVKKEIKVWWHMLCNLSSSEALDCSSFDKLQARSKQRCHRWPGKVCVNNGTAGQTSKGSDWEGFHLKSVLIMIDGKGFLHITFSLRMSSCLGLLCTL